MLSPDSSRQKAAAATAAAAARSLLLTEGLAVGALILGRICLVGTHQNPVQRTVVLVLAVVSAGLDGAFNALVCMTVHNLFLLLFGTALVWHRNRMQLMEILSF